MSKVRIYTRTGDKGETGLIGGIRVPKNSPRIEAYGSIDELNSLLGLVRSLSKLQEINNLIKDIQRDLFTISAELAAPKGAEGLKIPQIRKEAIDRLEREIDNLDKDLEPLTRFIIPSGSSLASYLHLARSVCRRAERNLVTLAQKEGVRDEILAYMNRLSDLLFMMARWVNKKEGYSEEIWE
ncbi:Cob(I)yrinic acid a,c-diamide adenosyltransferase [archaeon HR06]|nr:Cob(I)yrinic acid a,c-diamide adenosyltransferase [archaeon HR06]